MQIDKKINEVYFQIFNCSPFWFIKKRVIVLYGGRRAGKSYDVATLLEMIVLTYPDVGVYCIRKVGKSLKKSVFKRHWDSFSKSKLLYSVVHPNKTDLSFTVKHNGSFIDCVGLDDPEKLKSVEGVTIIHWEEVTECSEIDFDTVDSGLSPTNYHAVHILTHNPIPTIPGELHWIQKRFLSIPHKMGVLAEKDDFAVLKTNYKHNEFCPEASKKVLEGYKKTNPNLYKMWVLGEFTDFEGVIFPHFELVDVVPKYLDFLGWGLDFGYSKDPVALLGVWGNSEELCIQGFIYETGLTNPQLISKMLEVGVKVNDDIIADSAEPKSIEELRQTFPYIEGVKKYADYKTDTIRTIYGYDLKMVSGDIALQGERASYCWKKDRKGNTLNRPADGKDHYMDAFIMVCVTKLNVPKASELFTTLG